MNQQSEEDIRLMTVKADELLFALKDDDYNSKDVDLLDYYKNWPVEGALHDIRRKVLRLTSLLLVAGKEPNNESIEDNFIDLLNYTRIGYAVYKHYVERDCE